MKRIFLGAILASAMLLHAEKIIVVDNAVIAKALKMEGLTDIQNCPTLLKFLFKDFGFWDSCNIPFLNLANLEDDFLFEFLEAVSLDQTVPIYSATKTSTAIQKPVYKGKTVSSIIAHWSTNSITSEQALNFTTKHINKTITESTKKKLYTNLANMTFDPSSAVQLLEPNNDAISVLQECKKNGYKLVLASNWNAQNFEALCKDHRFSTIYKQLFIDDNQSHIILAEKHKAKPFQTMYTDIIETYEVKAKNCIAIETEKKYVSVAEGCGMQGIPYTDSETLRTHLEKLGVLPEETE